LGKGRGGIWISQRKNKNLGIEDVEREEEQGLQFLVFILLKGEKTSKEYGIFVGVPLQPCLEAFVRHWFYLLLPPQINPYGLTSFQCAMTICCLRHMLVVLPSH